MPLDFDGQRVRVIMIRGEPWWVLADVAKVLGYKLATDAARLLRDKEKGMHQTHTLGGGQNVVVISEAGLYRLIMRSNKPNAERFQDWVCEEVLPAIRKTGSYQMGRIAKTAKRLKSNIPTALPCPFRRHRRLIPPPSNRGGFVMRSDPVSVPLLYYFRLTSKRSTISPENPMKQDFRRVCPLDGWALKSLTLRTA